MTGQEALTLVDTLLHSANQHQGLNDVQSEVFLQTWAGRSYGEIAKQLGYQLDYIKQVGSQLWRSLSQTLGEPVWRKYSEEAVGELAEGQAPHPKAWVERLS